MENISSSYIKKLIFTNLDERRKLALIKYNKSLQNAFDINIINYKLFSGSIIKYRNYKKGKRIFGKEYDSVLERLIFEGEYLNGKRNGKGKEYYGNCKLKFEGEYLNDKRNGKGKKYYDNGKLEFEGEYLNNKRWNGKKYDKNQRDIYELKNGKGIIKKYYDNGVLEFEGEYLNGMKNGKGKEYYGKGEIKFDGEYKDGLKWEGKIYDIVHNITSELKEGKGIIKEYNGSSLVFEGEYLKW